jgi:hypothetical protein
LNPPLPIWPTTHPAPDRTVPLINLRLHPRRLGGHHLPAGTLPTGIYATAAVQAKVSTDTRHAAWMWKSQPHSKLKTVLQARFGQLPTNKLLHRYDPVNHDPHCPFCGQLDGGTHLLMCCAHQAFKAHYISRHNGAAQLILRAIARSPHAPLLQAADVGLPHPMTQLHTPALPTRPLDPASASPLPYRPDILLHNPHPLPCDPSADPPTPDHAHYTIIEVGYGMDLSLDITYSTKLLQHRTLRDRLAPRKILYLPIALGATGALHSTTHDTLNRLHINNVPGLCHKLIAHALHTAHTIKRDRLARAADQQPP